MTRGLAGPRQILAIHSVRSTTDIEPYSHEQTNKKISPAFPTIQLQLPTIMPWLSVRPRPRPRSTYLTHASHGHVAAVELQCRTTRTRGTTTTESRGYSLANNHESESCCDGDLHNMNSRQRLLIPEAKTEQQKPDQLNLGSSARAISRVHSPTRRSTSSTS